jgi:hypothetical protein
MFDTCNSDTILISVTAALLPAYRGGVFGRRALSCWVETEGFSCFYQNLQGYALGMRKSPATFLSTG